MMIRVCLQLFLHGRQLGNNPADQRPELGVIVPENRGVFGKFDLQSGGIASL
jgi:hypothetical protein